MGFNFISSSSSFDKNRNNEQKHQKPNYEKYSIKRIEEINNFLILKINYPDFSNFEGNKILMFKNCKIVDLIEQKTIDPHFSDNKNYFSPIARFEPTQEGWDMAVKLAKISI